MNVGWVGLGKLGLTCAAVLADRGHQVLGYDVVPGLADDILNGDVPPPHEEGFEELDKSRLKVVRSVAEVVAGSDIVFVAVQTPHAPTYGGETPAPAERRDFEYGFLVAAVREVCTEARRQERCITLVVVSTVLPGTCNRLIRPVLNDWVRLVYNPFFIAMGTTIRDFLNPEFVLLGVDHVTDTGNLMVLYDSLHDVPHQVMDIESAELTKVSYNTFISMKIVWANALMEIAHKTGADCDRVVDALSLATDRLISPAYMRGGMGDGGHCHPRDLIAMSWLAERLDLSYDLLGEMAWAREVQSEWLADLVQQWRKQAGHPVMILGKAYKPESPLTGGSPALLLFEQLAPLVPGVTIWDPHVDHTDHVPFVRPHVFVVGTKHPEFAEYTYPASSVVLDPWGYIPDQAGVTVVRIGRKS